MSCKDEIECPYCEGMIYICLDDGPPDNHEIQECTSCNKKIKVCHEYDINLWAEKAPCENEEPHEFIRYNRHHPESEAYKHAYCPHCNVQAILNEDGSILRFKNK